VTTPAVQPTVLTEQQQYQLALDSLLQEEQYQRAVSEFDQYLTQYPNGRFVTNAYYWKGQGLCESGDDWKRRELPLRPS